MKEKNKVGWTFLGVVLVSLTLGSVLYIIFVKLLNSEEIYNTLVENQVCSTILSQVFLMLPAIIYVIRNRKNIDLRLHKIKIINIILIVVWSFMLMPIMNFINLISLLFAENKVDNTIVEIKEQMPLLAGIMLIAVLPAICEEITYRGVFYNFFRKGGVLKGAVITGLLFGCAHMNFNQFTYAFLMGIVFSLLLEATNSIFSGMIVHLIINGTSLVTAYMMDNEALEKEAETSMSKQEVVKTLIASVPVVVVCIVVSTLIFILIAKKANRWEYIKKNFVKKGEKESIVSIWLVLGIVLTFLMMIVLDFESLKVFVKTLKNILTIVRI